MDEDQDKLVDFDNLYQTFHQGHDADDDFFANLAFDDDQNNPRTDLVTEEQQLSQKLSQLAANIPESEQQQPQQQEVVQEQGEVEQEATTMKKKRPPLTPTTPTAETASKEIKTTLDIDEKDDADLPRFLSRTKDIFQESLKPLLDKTAGSITIEHLRKIALLKFDIAVNDLHISLWNTYLRSGTGKILESEQQPQKPQATTTATSTTSSHFKRWPSDVKTKILESSSDTTMNRQKINDETCINYVSKMLDQFRDKNFHCYNELQQRKRSLANSFTVEMEEVIDKFVEQYGTAFHRVPINGQISIVEFQYKDRLMELDFYEQNPYGYQVRIYLCLCIISC